MKTITIAGVDIDIYNGPIGIEMSGGADSSLLFYILLKYATGPIHVIHLCAKHHQRALVKQLTEVIGFCIDEQQSPTLIMMHIVFIYKTLPPIAYFYGKKFVDTGTVNITYTGMTALPTPEDQSTFNIKGPNTIYRDRNPGEQKNVYGAGTYNPFINIDKKKIKEMYDELNLTNSLFPITRSCDNPEWTEGSCCECWWCEERKWAFGTYY